MNKEVSTPGLVCSSPLAQVEQELSQCWVIGEVASFLYYLFEEEQGLCSNQE